MIFSLIFDEIDEWSQTFINKYGQKKHYLENGCNKKLLSLSRAFCNIVFKVLILIIIYKKHMKKPIQKYALFSLILLLAIIQINSIGVEEGVGFSIGEVQGYKLLRQSGQSKLYEIECPQIKDGRPMKLIQLIGTHYEVGYAYGSLLGQQIMDNYQIFMSKQVPNKLQLRILQLFLDWQYSTLLQKNIPQQFNDQLKGIQMAGRKMFNVDRMRNLVQRVLVVSAYPTVIKKNVMHAMFDAFLQNWLKIKNPKILNLIENNLFAFQERIRKIINKNIVHCSFMAAWGSRTKNGDLYTMRNLDWNANTGMNQNKIIFVWKVKGTIPHTTIGFPGITGALLGMSQAGLTVHQAGLDLMKETELGFQWTLRLRYILMKAKSIAEAKAIWLSTKNTFGLNHMIASASDVKSGNAPVLVLETMRDYSAMFVDKDPREDNVNFTDPKTKKSYRAGYAMKDVVWRTNHAYDPTIIKSSTIHPQENSYTMWRYRQVKDCLNNYESGAIGWEQALNITAIVAAKGGSYYCPKGKDVGTNVISAMFIPGESVMYAAVEYGYGQTYRTACCGVYLHIDMKPWFAMKEDEISE